VHLATHGFFQSEGEVSIWDRALGVARAPEPGPREGAFVLEGPHPGRLAGLVCSGGQRLTAERLQGLDLGGLRLAVLSACNTGLGNPRSGEGLIGLQRACRVAGAETVVSAVWPVGDDETVQLMERFYRNLWFARMGRLEALRTAQRSLLEERYPPSAWGGFVLWGEWR